MERHLLVDGASWFSGKPHGGYLLRAAVQGALDDAHLTRWR